MSDLSSATTVQSNPMFKLSSTLSPFNLAVFYSPIIVPVLVLSWTLVAQNFKGFIYLLILIVMVAVRLVLYPNQDLNTSPAICNQLTFGSKGNASLSAYVFAFTITYVLMPMISNKEINVFLIVGLAFYFFLDIFARVAYKCMQGTDYFINALAGTALGVAWVYIMGQIDSGKYLLFNELSSNTETCSMPSKQTFKCSVFKGSQEIAQLPM